MQDDHRSQLQLGPPVTHVALVLNRVIFVSLFVLLKFLTFVVTSRRSDLEILGYVMLQWLCDRLPWENNLENKEYVKNEKIR